MFRKLLTISIFFSMCIFIFAQNHGEDKSAISFETIIDENKDFFEQNDSVEYLSSHKKVNGLQHYYIGSRRACKLRNNYLIKLLFNFRHFSHENMAMNRL